MTRQMPDRRASPPHAAARATVLANARMVLPTGPPTSGWLRIEGGIIADLGRGEPPVGMDHVEDLAEAWVVPGFIDLHVHGGGGASLASGDRSEILRALAFHLRHGTTRAVASLVTAPVATLESWLDALAQVSAAGADLLAGSHLEGPFLNTRRRGAHDPGRLLAPDRATMARLLEAGRDTLRLVTLAPELPGGAQLVEQVVAAGPAVALGHSDATYAEAVAAVEAGASHVTHLFNGMRPFHHREPGLVGAALVPGRTVSELIVDGVHLHDAAVRLAFAALGADRIALVTDAIPAAGAPDGVYELGSMPVLVRDGRAELPDGSSIAGSTLTMDRAVRRAVIQVGLPIEEVVKAASMTPARVLGIEGRVGSLARGKAADLVVLDADLQLRAVMTAGRWLERTPGESA